MNTIFLLRHAQAHGIEAYDHDKDRELTHEGIQDARRLGRFLAATDQVPDCFVTSTAVRARQMTDALPAGGQWIAAVPLRSTHGLYEAEPADVLEELQATKNEVQTVMIVGHEPALSTVASQLLGSANISLPPCTCVRIDTDEDDWQEVRFGSGVLRWMIPPKLLR